MLTLDENVLDLKNNNNNLTKKQAQSKIMLQDKTISLKTLRKDFVGLLLQLTPFKYTFDPLTIL